MCQNFQMFMCISTCENVICEDQPVKLSQGQPTDAKVVVELK